MPAKPLPASGLEALLDRELGTSAWHELTQHSIERYLSATGDCPQGEVAPPLLVASLIGGLIDEVVDASALGQALNYGLDAVAFAEPVTAGCHYRLRVSLAHVEARHERVSLTYDCRLEVKDAGRLACQAHLCLLYLGAGAAGSA